MSRIVRNIDLDHQVISKCWSCKSLCEFISVRWSKFTWKSCEVSEGKYQDILHHELTWYWYSSMFLVDKTGPQRLLVASMLLSAICAMMFAFHTDDSAFIVVFLSCLFNACSTAAWNAVSYFEVHSLVDEL